MKHTTWFNEGNWQKTGQIRISLARETYGCITNLEKTLRYKRCPYTQLKPVNDITLIKFNRITKDQSLATRS